MGIPVEVEEEKTVAESYETIEVVSREWHGRLFNETNEQQEVL